MLEPHTVLQNRYKIIRLIADGGMGSVYLAIDEKFDNAVALKRNSLNDERLGKAFEREARMLNKLRHPALPKVIDYFKEENGQFLVMEFIPGDDLGTVLEKRKKYSAPRSNSIGFTVDEVLLWAGQLLDVLEYLHTADPQIIHRDIKPQNLKLSDKGQIILLDFGLAKGLPIQLSRVTSSGSILGYTPIYAPIEQVYGQGTDERSDLYSLGATLYHLLVGSPPIDALTRATRLLEGQSDPLESAHRLNPEIPAAVAEALMYAMALNRHQRPTTAAHLRSILRVPVRPSRAVAESTGKTVLIGSLPDNEIPQSLMASGAETRRDKIEDYSSTEKRVSQPSYSNAPFLSSPTPNFAVPAQPNHPQPNYLQPDHSSRKNTQWKWIAAGVALFLVMGILGAVIYQKVFLNKSQTPTAPVKTPRELATEKTDQAMEMLYVSDYDEAKALSKEAIDIDPTYALAHAIHGDAYWDTDEDIEDASINAKSQICKGEIFKIFDAKEPSTEGDFAARGWAYLANKQWDKAKQDIEKAVAQKPDWGWALMQKGFVLNGAGCVKEKDSKESLDAIANYKKVNSIRPKYAMAYMNLGAAYRCNGQNSEALAAYERAINVKPLPKFYIRRGFFYLDIIDKKTEQKYLENAQKDFADALTKDPADSMAYLGLARIREYKKEFGECVTEADRALSKMPSYQAFIQRSDCRNALASKEKDETGFDEALESLEKARQELNKYNDPTLQQNSLANYYYRKAGIHYNRAFYLFTEVFVKNKSSKNRDRVKAELENSRSAMNSAIENNQNKDAVKGYENFKKTIEQSIRLVKNNFG